MNALDHAGTDYLSYLSTHGYAATTVHVRRYHLAELNRFLAQRDVHDPRGVTPLLLESYQRHLFHHQKVDGTALSFRTQSQRLVAVKEFFKYLAKSGALVADPAQGLTLPKTERRLPEAVLSSEEVEAVLALPDTTTPLGLRDRCILEVFYSCALRRMELINLQVNDIDVARGSLFVRQGKGARDRFVPIGARASYWVTRYVHEVRPSLARDTRQGTLFLSATGRPLLGDVLSRVVAGYIRAGVGDKKGSCHLFRHTTATLLLDAGADVRHVAEILGHQKLDTTMQYTRVSMAKLQEVHARCHPAEKAPRGAS
jgi:integrase/recombinase XerD